MSNLKSPYVMGLAAVAGLGLIAVAAIAAAPGAAPDAGGPRVEKRDIVVRVAPPAFADVDTNKDGSISQSEFDSFHAEHTAPLDEDAPPPPPPGDKPMHMRAMGAEALDANKDGKITFAEFTGPMKAHFDELDANKDGVLDESEMPKDRMFGRRPR